MVTIDIVNGFRALPEGKISCAEVKITSYVIRKAECYNRLYQDVILPERCNSALKNVVVYEDQMIITLTDYKDSVVILENMMKIIDMFEKEVGVQNVADEMTIRLERIVQRVKFKYGSGKWY